jgi:hypothetical protein
MNNLLFIAFNRPDLTRISLGTLLELKWDNIVVYVDGPRTESEKGIVQETVTLIHELTRELKQVHITERLTNWGCRRNLSDALHQFFSTCGSGWVFEDDISVFNPNALKDLRANWTNQGHLALYGTQPNSSGLPESTNNGHYPIWGWYLSYSSAPQFSGLPLSKVLQRSISTRGIIGGLRFMWVYVKTLLGILDTWDSIYTAWCLINKVPCYTATQKIIENIGFDDRATHTKKIPKDYPL